MKSPFKDPIAPKERKASFNFAAPTKEQATTGRWMNAGDNHGVGFKTPAGKYKASSIQDGPILQGCHRIDPNTIA